jgi:soluble lytic murein transglycosylase-like protein
MDPVTLLLISGVAIAFLRLFAKKKTITSPPKAIAAALQAASKKYNVPLSILTGVAYVESRFDNSQISPAGAIGVMQLMPGTASGLGVDPYNATQNIMGGAKYLSILYKKYGDWNTVFAAYNWGPGNVDKSIPWPGSVQLYIRKVNEATV